MTLAFLRAVKLPYGGLLPVGIPVVLPALLPSEQARLMLPLVGTPPKNKALLLPDAAPGKVESRRLECAAEIQSLGIGMEHINRGIALHVLLHIYECGKKEVIELLIFHVVIPDLPGAPFIINVVRRLRNARTRINTGFSLLQNKTTPHWSVV